MKRNSFFDFLYDQAPEYDRLIFHEMRRSDPWVKSLFGDLQAGPWPPPIYEAKERKAWLKQQYLATLATVRAISENACRPKQS